MGLGRFNLLFITLTVIVGLTPLAVSSVHAQVPSIGQGKCYGNCPDQGSPSGGWKGTQPAPSQHSERDRATDAFNAGVQLQRQGLYDEAIKRYREAIRLNPGYGKAYNNIGSVFMLLGRRSEAIPMFRRAVELGGSENAQKNLEIALAEDTQSHAKENQRLADEFMKKGDYDRAIVLLRENIRIYPGAYGHNNLGVALHKQGNKFAAAEEFRKALALDPAYSTARENLARVNKEIEDQKGIQEAKVRTERMLDDLAISSKVTVPVDLSFMDPDQPLAVDPARMAEDRPKQKGLRVKEVPLPAPVAYNRSNPPEKIIYNALRVGGPDIRKSARDLESFLTKNDPQKKNVSARFALSVLKKVVKALDDKKDTTTEAVLLEAIAAAGRRPWPGPTKGPDRIPAPGILRGKTTELILDALEANAKDWQGSFRYLAKLADDPTYPHREEARTALSNLREIYEETLKPGKAPSR